MDNSSVKQTDNIAGGDIVGGNKTSTTHNTVSVTHNKSAYLKELYQKFLNEEQNNEQFKAFIEELDYYNSQIENEEVIGLDKKLIAGNRENILWYAKEVKERFHKKLIKSSQFSLVYQKISVYLLATVRSYYMLEVYPSVCANSDATFINSLIQEKIITPLMTELGENLFDFTPEDIQGMMYFLTGNCHIKWTA